MGGLLVHRIRKIQTRDRKLSRKLRQLGLPDYPSRSSTESQQKNMLERFGRHRVAPAEFEDLRHCNMFGCTRTPCSAACWVNAFEQRRTIIPQAAKLFFEFGKPVYAITIISPKYRFQVGELDQFEPKNFQQWLARRLRRLTRKHGEIIALGTIEATLNIEQDGSKYWSPHGQLVIAGASPIVFRNSLRPKLTQNHSEKPVMVKPVLCLGRALGYATKRHPQQREAYIDETTRRQNRRKSKLRSNELVEHDRWLLKHDWDDFFFLYGLRRHHGQLIRIAAGDN